VDRQAWVRCQLHRLVPLGPITIDRRDLGPDDVLIEIKYTGICHSDIHLAHSEWKIPEGLALDVAAPLLCAGITTYSPLRHWGVGPGKKVALAGVFDLIINTVSATIDLDAYLSLLAVDGALVNVGAPVQPLSLNVFSLIHGRRSIAGSAIGGIRETQKMLDFCSEHHLGAEVEVIPADQINEAYARVLAADVRYRFVIDTSTLG
jgi:uncharacterized zinc-type alcohol dehydrogenase-like protein